MFGWLFKRTDQVAADKANDDTLSAMLIAQLRSEITYLRAQQVVSENELAYLRRSVVALADRRAVAEIEFYKEANLGPNASARTTAPPAEKKPNPGNPADLGTAWANGLYGDDHIEYADPNRTTKDESDMAALEDELAEQNIEAAAAERERRRLQEAGQ